MPFTNWSRPIQGRARGKDRPERMGRSMEEEIIPRSRVSKGHGSSICVFAAFRCVDRPPSFYVWLRRFLKRKPSREGGCTRRSIYEKNTRY